VEDIQTLLYEWARWSKSRSGAARGYPSRSAFYRMSRKGQATLPEPQISDALGGILDRAISTLRMRCEAVKGDLRHDVLTDSYLLGMSDSAIQRRLRASGSNVSRETVKTARRAAESWVESQVADVLMDVC